MFKINGPVSQFLNKVADLILLNILFLLCCIPVVTIGPAFTAMYYVTLKMVRNEEAGIAKSFFHSFRQNLRQGVIINIISLLVGALLAVDIFAVLYTSEIGTTLTIVLLCLLGILVMVYLVCMLYIYPILAKFNNTVMAHLKWSLVLAVSHLPVTLLCLVLAAAPILLAVFATDVFTQYGLPLLLIVGFAGLAYLQSQLYVGVFDWYIPQEDSEDESETANEEE